MGLWERYMWRGPGPSGVEDFLAVDGPNAAPPFRNPGMIRFPNIKANQPWFQPWFLRWCDMDFATIHSTASNFVWETIVIGGLPPPKRKKWLFPLGFPPQKQNPKTTPSKEKTTTKTRPSKKIKRGHPQKGPISSRPFAPGLVTLRLAPPIAHPSVRASRPTVLINAPQPETFRGRDTKRHGTCYLIPGLKEYRRKCHAHHLVKEEVKARSLWPLDKFVRKSRGCPPHKAFHTFCRGVNGKGYMLRKEACAFIWGGTVDGCEIHFAPLLKP